MSVLCVNCSRSGNEVAGFFFLRKDLRVYGFFAVLCDNVLFGIDEKMSQCWCFVLSVLFSKGRCMRQEARRSGRNDPIFVVCRIRFFLRRARVLKESEYPMS
jgi:hypothetical protein